MFKIFPHTGNSITTNSCPRENEKGQHYACAPLVNLFSRGHDPFGQYQKSDVVGRRVSGYRWPKCAGSEDEINCVYPHLVSRLLSGVQIKIGGHSVGVAARHQLDVLRRQRRPPLRGWRCCSIPSSKIYTVEPLLYGHQSGKDECPYYRGGGGWCPYYRGRDYISSGTGCSKGG